MSPEKGPLAASLRPHHLVCLLAFSGQGYSPAFTRRFRTLRSLYLRPDSRISVVLGPDDACAACPHLSPAGCASPTDGPEPRILDLDRAVLDALDLAPGTIAAAHAHSRVAVLSPAALRALCASCSWYGRADCLAILTRRLARRKLP